MEHLNPTKLEKFAYDFFRQSGAHYSFSAMVEAALNAHPREAEIGREAAVIAYYDAKQDALQPAYEAALRKQSEEIKQAQGVQWASL